MVHYFGCIICTVLLDETYTVSIFMYSVYVHVHTVQQEAILAVIVSFDWKQEIDLFPGFINVL